MEKYVAQYFKKTKKIIKNKLPHSIVVLQFFQRKDDSILSGIIESIDFLKKNTNINKYEVLYLEEGSRINSKDVVLQLKGNYSDFGLYEGIIDGILSRATSLATNSKSVIEAANNKDVIFMGDRSDHYLNQERDGYSISIGGIKTQVTDAHIEMHNGNAVGTMPHALIQMFEGDLIKALTAYHDIFPDENLVALVDFNNDVICDSLKAFKEFGKLLTAVRVDTSLAISDKMFKNNEEYGVTPNMIKNLRKALDEQGAMNVKIIASSGFNVDKIKLFESEFAPVDIYGVGASLLQIKNTFTADAVEINGKCISKVGRSKNSIINLIKLK